jgi:exosortase A-associated hydrolase 1
MIVKDTAMREVPVSFLCGDARLHGMLHQAAQLSALGILIVTGRPALRAGRHRLFVLLARSFAHAGIPAMRFDFRGTGDCEGVMGTLDETSEDIATAIDAFMSNVPGLQKIALWGLCGGAADSVLYAPRDRRVAGIAMVNPWSYDPSVRTLSKLNRFASQTYKQVQRWAGNVVAQKRIGQQTTSGEVEPAFDLPEGAFQEIDEQEHSSSQVNTAINRAYSSYRVSNLSKRLVDSLEKFDGQILLILSGQDTGSRAFKHAASISPRWRRLLSAARVQSHELPDANHSLRRREWREQAATWTVDWMRMLQV